MAVLQINKPFTLAEANKINGNVELGNLLADFQQRNTFLDEVPWFPTTHGSHTEEFRAKFLDEGEFTEINAGIPRLGSTGDILKEPTKIYEGESAVDDRLMQLADDPFQARDTYDRMNLEGILQGFNRRLLYSKDANDDKALKALDQRKGNISQDVTSPACNFVFDMGGTDSGDLTSAWLFEFGRAGFHMIYNKAGSVGIKNEDYGLRDRPPADGNGFIRMWIRHYQIIAGIVEGAAHSCMRLANISVDPTATTGKFDPAILIESMLPYLSDPSGSGAVLFVSRPVWGQINKALFDKGNIMYSRREVEGYSPVPEIMGVPIRPWDAIGLNETRVT